MLNNDLLVLTEQIKSTIKAGDTISTAESCTGGMVASCLTELPGASEYFTSGIISYSNESKIKFLSVMAETLEEFGGVSEEVAKEMALGSRNCAESDIAISITGIAGPGGGTKLKPIGMVCFGVSTSSVTQSVTYHFKGSRAEIRHQACIAALKLILDCYKI